MVTVAKQRLLIQQFQISGALPAAAQTTVWVPPRSKDLSQGPAGSGTLADSAGTATAGTTNTLTDGGKTWVVNAYRGSVLRITAGSGAGEANLIESNTATVLTCTRLFRTALDNTSVYRIEIPTDELIVLKSIYLSHATIGSTVITMESRSSAALGTATAVGSQIWGYNSGASIAGNILWSGSLTGSLRGQIDLTTSTAATGQLTVEGYYLANTTTSVIQTLI